MSLPHPDFDLYDNVGRTTEQIDAHRDGRPTTDDLYRWAAYDAREFNESLTIGGAGQSIADWTHQLQRVRTAAEFQTVAQAVLGTDRSGLAELHMFLETAAEWCERNQEPSVAARYRRHAEELSELGDQLSYVSDDHLARTYRRPTRSPTGQSASGPAAASVALAPPAPRHPFR